MNGELSVSRMSDSNELTLSCPSSNPEYIGSELVELPTNSRRAQGETSTVYVVKNFEMRVIISSFEGICHEIGN